MVFLSLDAHMEAFTLAILATALVMDVSSWLSLAAACSALADIVVLERQNLLCSTAWQHKTA